MNCYIPGYHASNFLADTFVFSVADFFKGIPDRDKVFVDVEVSDVSTLLHNVFLIPLSLYIYLYKDIPLLLLLYSPPGGSGNRGVNTAS